MWSRVMRSSMCSLHLAFDEHMEVSTPGVVSLAPVDAARSDTACCRVTVGLLAIHSCTSSTHLRWIFDLAIALFQYSMSFILQKRLVIVILLEIEDEYNFMRVVASVG